MNFEAKIRTLCEQYLADIQAPDMTGFVDQLFRVAAEVGGVACVFEGGKQLRFSSNRSPTESRSSVSTATRRQTTCHIDHPAARTILRMICARLAAICKEHAANDVSPYGGTASVECNVDDHKRWTISFTNTPDQQEFSIEAL